MKDGRGNVGWIPSALRMLVELRMDVIVQFAIWGGGGEGLHIIS